MCPSFKMLIINIKTYTIHRNKIRGTLNAWYPFLYSRNTFWILLLSKNYNFMSHVHGSKTSDVFLKFKS